MNISGEKNGFTSIRKRALAGRKVVDAGGRAEEGGRAHAQPHTT